MQHEGMQEVDVPDFAFGFTEIVPSLSNDVFRKRFLGGAAYAARGEDNYSAFVEPLAVGDALPDMPLFLSERFHIPTPLEETYTAAWNGFPEPLREIIL